MSKTNGKPPRKRPAKDAARAEVREAKARKAKGQETYEAALLTAAAWVSAIRVRVKELAREAGRLDAVRGHPDRTAARVILDCALPPAAVGKFINTVYELEGMLDDLLESYHEQPIPDLPAACRVAAVAYMAEHADGGSKA